MNTCVKIPLLDSVPSISQRFQLLWPSILKQARFAFRHVHFEQRQELVAEVAANAFVAYVRLVERRLEAIVYPSALARFAIRQVSVGRRVGTRQNTCDVSSEFAQRTNRFTVERLDGFDEQTGQWKATLVEDRRVGPAETAAARIDIADWFASLPAHKRRIAATLATGETTKRTARKFGVSTGRISQTRRELQQAWQDFQGEPTFT